MSIYHITKQETGSKIDLFCDNLTTEGTVLDRASWAVKSNDLASDQIVLLEGLAFEPSPTAAYPFARCGTVEFRGLRKDLLDDDAENFYFVKREGTFLVTVSSGTADRTWTFPNFPFPGLEGDYDVIKDSIVAHELTADATSVNGVEIAKTYRGSVNLINDNFITCGFPQINVPSDKVWLIEYDIAVGKSGNL
jgi:hypothetical protein